MLMNKKKLFSEFPPITTEQWESVVVKDLKGADYERKLIRKTLDGINIRPYYRNENLHVLQHLTDKNPGEFPYVRGNKLDNNWLIRQDIHVSDYKTANEQAIESIQKGAESISFIIKNMTVVDFAGISDLLVGFPFETIELNLSAGKRTKDLVRILAEYLNSQKIDLSLLKGSISYDPLGCLTVSGSLCEQGLGEGNVVSKEVIELASKSLPNFEIITVHANYLKNAGSTIVQELAFGLSMANDYLASAISSGFSVIELAPKIRFNFAIGPEYFMEIAKIRAARYLWAKIVEAYGHSGTNVAKMKIHSVTAEYNQTIYDPYVNMLRSTTESMAAVIGGTDSLTVLPFNIQFDNANSFSERIARNQQILLKKESYLDKVADPSAGAYFVEDLTNSIIEAAWKLILEVEEKGGYFAAFKQGFIQENIAKTAQKRDANLASKQEILLGTNQYPNFKEKAKETIKVKAKKPGKGASCEGKVAEPIKIYRAAEAFEELRLATENSGKTPMVFLLTYGNLAMRKARATFATNFFACAGFEVIDNLGFATPKEGIDAAIDSKAEIVVICSSDEEYPVISKEIFDGLKNKVVAIAGYPKDSLEQLQSFGIKYFIHIRSNVLETLKSFQKTLGIG
jgi:methylmalonyl-CoA mutase